MTIVRRCLRNTGDSCVGMQAARLCEAPARRGDGEARLRGGVRWPGRGGRGEARPSRGELARRCEAWPGRGGEVTQVSREVAEAGRGQARRGEERRSIGKASEALAGEVGCEDRSSRVEARRGGRGKALSRRGGWAKRGGRAEALARRCCRGNGAGSVILLREVQAGANPLGHQRLSRRVPMVLCGPPPTHSAVSIHPASSVLLACPTCSDESCHNLAAISLRRSCGHDLAPLRFSSPSRSSSSLLRSFASLRLRVRQVKSGQVLTGKSRSRQRRSTWGRSRQASPGQRAKCKTRSAQVSSAPIRSSKGRSMYVRLGQVRSGHTVPHKVGFGHARLGQGRSCWAMSGQVGLGQIHWSGQRWSDHIGPSELSSGREASAARVMSG